MKILKFFCLILFALILNLINANKLIYQNFYIDSNSDLLYSYLFTNDLISNFKYALEWDLTPSNYLFFDVILVYFINLFLDSVFYIYLIYHLFFFGLFCFILIFFFQIDKSDSVLISIFTLSIFSFFPDKLGLFFFPTYHSFAFLIVLVFLKIESEFCEKFLDIKKKLFYLILFSLILFSDKILITILILPYFIFDYKNLKTNIKNFIPVILFSIILEKLFLQFQIFHLVKISFVSIIKQSFSNYNFITHMNYIIEIFINDFLKIESLILFLYLFYFLIPKEKRVKYRFLFFSILFHFGFQLIFQIYGGFRYNWFLYLIPIFIFTEYLILIQKKVLIIIILIFILLINYQNLYFQKEIYPDRIKCIDEISNIQFGLTDYWNAKYIRAFSKKNIKTTQRLENLNEYNWIQNRNWEKEIVKIDFIIPTRLDKNKIKEKYSEPNSKKICAKEEIWIYK